MRAETAASFETRVELLLASGRGYMLTERDNIYHHETLREAAVQFQGLRDRGLAPALTSCKTGELLTWDLVRAYCPHQAIDATGRVVGDSEDGQRPDGWTKIAHVCARVFERFWDKVEKREKYPLGEPPKFKNLWTGEVLDFRRAVSLACRATPPAKGAA